ncbi:MAG TPA: SIMPL domain-containing protein [Candidatus Paceibacterota bacterium]|nr:SIMPL domain-containing protein [Candidatus Paceibacterota bacterium]
MNNLNDIVDNGLVRAAVVGVLAILALFLFVETIGGALAWSHPDTPAANTITVTGQGQASVAPDIATITYTVSETGATVSEAQNAATEKSNAALTAVTGLGVDEKDIRTVSYNVNPQYEETPCGGVNACPKYLPPANQRIVGYEVSETIAVKVRDLDKTGDVLQTLGGLGVQNIYGPDLGLDNPNAGQDAARANAIANAKKEAQTLAAQLGVHLVRIVSFNDNQGGVVYPMFKATAMSAGSDAAAPAPSIPTGQNDYSDSVTITYEIR